MSFLALLFLSSVSVWGLPTGNSRVASDSTDKVRLPPEVEVRAIQVDAHTHAMLQLRRVAHVKITPYPRNLDRHEGYSVALDERSETLGPVIPPQEKLPTQPAPQNL